ncbi:MAG: tyrosine-type recombinase/integrase [Halobacteriovoraceae bacterium]|nr:tyrosine-type recombinase/integrase [Halobacteriovoraceae bacterium]
MKLSIKSEQYDLISSHDLRDNPFFFEFFENFNSEHTKKNYKIDINQFFDFIKSYIHQVSSLKDIERVHAVAFKKWLADNDYAPKTINRKLSSVSSFFDYLVEKNLMEYNIFSSIKRPRQTTQNATNDLSDSEIQTLLDVVTHSKSSSKPLHRAILYTLFTTGMRKSELINLKRRDFFKEKDHAMVKIVAKGGKSLTKVLPAETAECIEEYLHWMDVQKRSVEAEDWLFQPTRNPLEAGHLAKPINPKSIDYIIKTYAKKCGISTRISPHSARASYIGSALENGADLYRVSQDVGHSSVKTTEIYDKRRRKISDSPIHHLGFLNPAKNGQKKSE